MIPIDSLSACSESALRSAARRSLRFTLNAYERGCGPNAMPPPVQIGERFEPARARPVPFWRHGLAPPPRTMPRVLVACVPCRRAASSARTDSWTSGPLKSAPNAPLSSLTAPEPPRILASAIRPDLHDPVARAGDGAADHEQVVLGADLDDLQALLGDALVAHLAR